MPRSSPGNPVLFCLSLVRCPRLHRILLLTSIPQSRHGITMSISGSCLCGKVRYEVAGSLGEVANCYCSMCRKAHGAAFATYANVRAEDFRWTAGEAFVSEYAASQNGGRCFCKNCGSLVAARYAGRIFQITLGTLDDDPGVRPGMHIFVGSKASWYEIADEGPKFAEWAQEMKP